MIPRKSTSQSDAHQLKIVRFLARPFLGSSTLADPRAPVLKL